MREQDRNVLRAAGAVAYGYCSGCRMPVELNEKSRCPRHPHRSVSNIRLALPEDVQSVKADILETRRRENRKRLIAGSSLFWDCCAVLYVQIQSSWYEQSIFRWSWLLRRLPYSRGTG
jgi:hypothetical protein